LEPGVFLGRRAAGAGPGDGPDGDLVVAQADQDLGRGARQLEVAEVQIEQERRRVGPAQRTVEGERVAGERRAQPVAWHDLEDVAGADVVLRLLDDLAVALAADR